MLLFTNMEHFGKCVQFYSDFILLQDIIIIIIRPINRPAPGL